MPSAKAALDRRDGAAVGGAAVPEDVRAPLPLSSRLIISLMAYTHMDLYSGVLHINLDQPLMQAVPCAVFPHARPVGDVP